jgi:membrane fusion protein (multidrug efflux system)
MLKKILMYLSLISILLISCKEEQVAIPELELKVVEAVQRDVPIASEFVGQTYGDPDIEIRARVDGWLKAISFEEGKLVTQGQLLYTIDQAPYQEKVNRAKASLTEAKTMEVKAQNNYNRVKPLADMKAMSQRDLDAAIADLGAAKANVEAAQALLQSAQIEYGYTMIKAPISGLIGVSQAEVGDYVGRIPNPVILNVVSNINTIKVRFSLTEQDYFNLIKIFKNSDSTSPKKEFGVELFLADGNKYPYKGKVNFADRQIDPATGTLLIEATFPNTDKYLRPGMFVRIRVFMEERKNAVIVPQRVVNEIQGIFQIFVFEGGKLTPKIVKVGPKFKDLWIIEEGIKPGDKVAVVGNKAVGGKVKIKPIDEVINVDSTLQSYLK